MRRAEFEITDEKELKNLLGSLEYGVLALNDEPYPYAVPVNFIYFDENIYFHGSREGRKHELASKNKKASFNAVKAYSFIPSHFSGQLACPSSQFFASAFLEGKLLFVDDIEKKAEILENLMRKYQSEGGYLNIEENIEKYSAHIATTSLFELRVDSWSLKIKAGQNMSEERRKSVMEKLRERGEKSDIESLEIMKKLYA